MAELPPSAETFPVEEHLTQKHDEHDALHRAMFAIQDKISDHEKSIWALRRKLAEFKRKTQETATQTEEISESDIASFKKVANLFMKHGEEAIEGDPLREAAFQFGKEAFKRPNWKDYEFKIERKARIRNLQAQKELWQSLYSNTKGKQRKQRSHKPSTDALLALTMDDIEKQREADREAAEAQEREEQDRHNKLLMAAAANSSSDSVNVDAELSNLGLSVFKPIAYLDSVYKHKHGAPRQGSVTSAAKARLKINMKQADAALEGLQDFSHVWWLFVFHLNNRVAVKAKIRPPRLKGKRIGLFATRTPHRPNPIGITLAKLDKVDHATGTLTVSGMDLLDGTPILDVKPFIPSYDNVKDDELRLPSWVTARDHLTTVDFSKESLDQLEALVKAKQLELYSEFEEAKECVRQVVQSDPRPGYMQEREGDHDFVVDRMHVYYHINVEKATVSRIEYEKPDRTAE